MRPPRPPSGRPPGRPPGRRPATGVPGGQTPAGRQRANRAAGPPRDDGAAHGTRSSNRRADQRPTRQIAETDGRPARRSDNPRKTEQAPRNRQRDATRRDPPPGRTPRAAVPVRETSVALQRIAKALARAGVGSRRDIERMIGEGRVAIDGVVLTSPALNISSLAGVTVDGVAVAGIAPARLYRFHKPAGFLTAARDPAGRPTIMDILPAALPRVMPVGRLDMNTEGLLLLTTDGELKRALELPASSVPRVYRVRAFGTVGQAALESLADGISIDGIHYGPILADIERRTGQNLWLTVTIREGKNREVRRVLEHLGLQVNRLIRTAYGPIVLADLPPRMADEVPEGDLQALRAMLKPAGKAGR